ncbi:hypothetical protein LINPERHAP2_LOCUS28945 [Linum perenne]
MSGGDSGRSWAAVVGSDPIPDLEYFPPVLVDGVLQIPSEVVDLGIEKFKSALIGQFLGPAPPLRVFQALANRLWNYDGFVAVSELSAGTFLIEFPTVSVCEWVLGRLWHVHHLPLFLKKWSLEVEPINLQPKEIPVWIQLHKVPVPLCTHEGIGRLASLVGKPISKFVRNGTSVKVCVLMDAEAEKPDLLRVAVARIQCEVEVVYPNSRVYKETNVKGVYGGKPVKKTVYVAKPVEPESNDGGETIKTDFPKSNSVWIGGKSISTDADNHDNDKNVTNVELYQSVSSKQGDDGANRMEGSTEPPSIEEVGADSSGGSTSSEDGNIQTKTGEKANLFLPEEFPVFKRPSRRGKKR